MKAPIVPLSVLLMVAPHGSFCEIPKPVLPASLPETIATCSEFKTSGDWKTSSCINNGPKSITGFAARCLEDTRLVIWVDVPLLETGKSYSISEHVSTPYQHIQVEAVIFADGTHIGRAPDPLRNDEDAIEQIFEWRQAQAQAWAEWKEQFAALPADDTEAVTSFLAFASKINKPAVARSLEEAGRSQAIDDIKRHAQIVGDALNGRFPYPTKTDAGILVQAPTLTRGQIRGDLISNWIVQQAQIWRGRSLDKGEVK